MNRKLEDIGKTDKACINCVCFERFDEQKKKENVLGACKANPPIAMPPLKDNSKLGFWPLVLGTFWCDVFTLGDK